VEGFWPIFFLMVVLKIPVLGALWLVWWASRAEPLPDDAPDEDGGFRFRNKGPRRPRDPRRGGPHGSGARPLPACPPSGRAHLITPPAPLRAGLAHAHGAAERGRHTAARS
jgi:hypothetical protein